jgi:ribosome-binding factor A
MSGVPRMTRVNELLKRELADLIKKNVEYSSDCLVSVTEVSVAPNLRHAKVLVSILGKDTDSEKMKILKKIENKRYIIQNQMSNHVVLKYTPVLEFRLDKKVEAGDRVLAILQKMEEGDQETD